MPCAYLGRRSVGQFRGGVRTSHIVDPDPLPCFEHGSIAEKVGVCA